MKSVTVHQIDDQMARMIEDEAKKRGTSMNKVIKSLLAQSLGMKPPAEGAHHEDFAEFCGVWSSDDAAEFASMHADFERVDPDDWR
jgi:hypothetical protein